MKIKNSRKNEADVKCELYFGKEPEDLSVLPKAEEVIRTAIQEALAYEEFFAPAEISVTFCDGPYIRELNAEYRDKDSETDVLSFPIFDQDEEDPVEGEIIPLGDIVLNVDRAAQQASELGHSTLREMAFLAIHSTLHLLGYDHERSPEDDEDMCRRQRDIITKIEDKLHNVGETL